MAELSGSPPLIISHRQLYILSEYKALSVFLELQQKVYWNIQNTILKQALFWEAWAIVKFC